MTEDKPDPPKSEAAKPMAAQPLPAGLPPPAAPPRDWVPTLYAIGFIVLACAVVWLWQNPPATDSEGMSQDVELLQQQVHANQDRLLKLEKRSEPVAATPAAPVDLGPLTARVAALEARKPPPVDLGPLTAQIAALEARKPPPPVDLGPLEAAIAKLEQRPVGDPATASRVDALAARLDALSSRADAAIARIAPLEKNTGQITALADRSTRIARIQAAQSALNSGVKLGDVPGAPPALAPYAAAAPPTEASLRLSFPAAADAALAASRPAVDDKPFLDRAWAKAQDLVTLRQGDHVIVGDPAAGVLAHAKAALDAGDLAGAVSVLGGLTGPSAAAMAGWKAQAQGLLDARKALADMAAHA
jgi:hypothetical protein